MTMKLMIVFREIVTEKEKQDGADSDNDFGESYKFKYLSLKRHLSPSKDLS